jgi:hypothetical protein
MDRFRIHHYSITLWSSLYMYHFTELHIIPYTYTDTTSLSISLYAPDSNIFKLYGNKDLYSPRRSWLSSCSPLIPQVLFQFLFPTFTATHAGLIISSNKAHISLSRGGHFQSATHLNLHPSFLLTSALISRAPSCLTGLTLTNSSIPP